MKRLSLFILTMLMAVNVALADQYCFFGYGTSTQTSVLSNNTKAKAAIYIPAEVAARYKGCYISKVRVGLASTATKLTVFVTKDLNKEYAVQGSTTTAFGGTTTDVTTDKYTIDGDGFYVGYEVEANSPAMALSDVANDNGCWADLGDGWKDYATDPDVKAPALCIDARISGTTVPVDANLIQTVGAVAKQGSSFNISSTVKNQGYSKITKLGFAYSINGGEEQNAEVTGLNITAGKSLACSFTVPENNYELGVYDLKVRITTVNGKEDEVADNNVGETQLNVVDFIPGKRLFVEEWTGVDCGYCPRGIVGFKHMYNDYPSRFVGVAVHCYDSNGPVAPDDYKSFINSLKGNKGFPGCIVFRQSPTTPSVLGLEGVMKNLANVIPYMRLEVEAKLSDDGKHIDATAFTTPISIKKGANYKLSFIITEDDVTGYTQLNNFAGSGDTSMDGWENKGSYVYEPLHHVARAVFHAEGFEGSVPSDYALNQQMDYPVQLDIPSNVQDKNNLNVIAIIVDSATGYVENAAEVRVGNNSVTGIHTADAIADSSASASAGVYTLQGIKVLDNADNMNSLPAGIYVVNGKKVMK